MTLPFPNPADPSYPNPYFQDNSFVRGDQARGNNQFIFADLTYLDNLQKPFQEYFSSEIAAKTNSIFYNGATLDRTTYAALWMYVSTTAPERTGQDSRYSTTSSTSKTIAIGPSFSMTVGAGLGYLAGQRVRMWHTGTTTQYVEGVVTSYSGTTLVFTSDDSGGSGTFAAWTFACADRTIFGMGDGSTTFRAPDWRGLFIRGAGSSGYYTAANGSAFAGGAVGAPQNDEGQGHIHDSTNSTVLFAVIGGGTQNFSSTPGGGGDGTVVTGGPLSDGTNGTPRTGAETRPANVAVNFGMFYV